MAGTFLLFRALAVERKGENIVLSPFSINRAILALTEGSNPSSTSFKQLATFLGPCFSEKTWSTLQNYTKKKEDLLSTFQIILWNEVKLKKPLDKFVTSMGETTEWIRVEDSKTLLEDIRKMNTKISKMTQGKMNELIQLTSEQAGWIVAILANAIVFKAKWAIPFDPELTKSKIFYTPYSKDVKKQMMKHEDPIPGFYSSHDNITLVELNYKDSKDIRMGLLLPHNSEKREVWETFLNTLSLKFLVDEIELLAEVKNLDIEVPKFEANERFDDLKEKLIALGVKEPFTTDFDFSRASEVKGACISKITHQVIFKVDEEGTEALAATAVVVAMMSVRKKPPAIQVVCNHPFFYYLRDSREPLFPTGLLYMGLVTA